MRLSTALKFSYPIKYHTFVRLLSRNIIKTLCTAFPPIDFPGVVHFLLCQPCDTLVMSLSIWSQWLDGNPQERSHWSVCSGSHGMLRKNVSHATKERRQMWDCFQLRPPPAACKSAFHPGPGRGRAPASGRLEWDSPEATAHGVIYRLNEVRIKYLPSPPVQLGRGCLHVLRWDQLQCDSWAVSGEDEAGVHVRACVCVHLCANISMEISVRNDFRGPPSCPFVLLTCHQSHDLLKFSAAKFLFPKW